MAVWQCGSVAAGRWGSVAVGQSDGGENWGMGRRSWESGVGARKDMPTSNPWMKIVASLPSIGSLMAGFRTEVMREC